MEENKFYFKLTFHKLLELAHNMNTRNIILEALSKLKTGNWEAAHNIAQSKEGQPDYDRLHALLHRIEGDEWNARYWYKRCKMEIPTITFQEELDELIKKYSIEK